MKKSVVATLTQLPSLPGVYCFYNEAHQTLYVGKAANLKKRISSYFRRKQSSPKIQVMVQSIDKIETTITTSEAEALLLENSLIKSLKPRYNILFRDDKSYPFLCLSDHPYPRLSFYRGNNKQRGVYFGPFPNPQAVRESIDILQQIFRLRTCPDSMISSRQRPCLLYQIKRCSAPCTNEITDTEYRDDVLQAQRFLEGKTSQVADYLRAQMEFAAKNQDFEQAAVFRDRLNTLAIIRARHFADDDRFPNAHYIGVYQHNNHACVNIVMVNGGQRHGERRLFPKNTDDSDSDDIISALLTQLYCHSPPNKIFFNSQRKDWSTRFPSLAKNIVTNPRGITANRLLTACENAQHALTLNNRQEVAREQRLTTLATYLSLPKPPRRLECFDVSHNMGEETMASRVVFIDGISSYRHYRLYAITQATKKDDCAAIFEAVSRCYRRLADAAEDDRPHVIFIDGGIGQVKAAHLALSKLMPTTPLPPLFGIAKGINRRAGEETIITPKGAFFKLPPDDSALHLIQALRDEAHRFALASHRRRRDKKRSRFSSLEGIEGIGASKKHRLITTFGGLAGLRAASENDISNINGIGKELANRVYQALHL